MFVYKPYDHVYTSDLNIIESEVLWSPMVQYEPLVIKIYKCNENVKTRRDNKKHLS